MRDDNFYRHLPPGPPRVRRAVPEQVLVGMGVPVGVPGLPLVARVGGVGLLALLVHGLGHRHPECLPDGGHVAVGQGDDGRRDGGRVVGGCGGVVGGGRRELGGRCDLCRLWAVLLRGGCGLIVLGVAGGEDDGG